MAKVYVTGYAGLAFDRNQLGMPSPLEPPVFEDVLDTGAGEDHTAALPDTCTLVRIHTDGIVSVSVGVGVTATTAKGRFAANQTEFRGVRPGQSFIVSAITNT